MLQIIALITKSEASPNCTGGVETLQELELSEPVTFVSWHRKYTPLSTAFFHSSLWCGRISDLHCQLVKGGYRDGPHLPCAQEFSAVDKAFSPVYSLWLVSKAGLEERFLTLKEMRTCSHWCPPSQSRCLHGTVEQKGDPCLTWISSHADVKEGSPKK